MADEMIQPFFLMLCGVAALACILRQQRIIQIQNEEIQGYREIVALLEQAIRAYKEAIRLTDEQNALLRDMLGQADARKENDIA